MSESKQYNGWTNYETWNVALWMDNDRGGHEYWEAMALEMVELAESDGHSTKEQVAKYELAKRIKEEHEENAPVLQGTYSDLLQAALSEVDWFDIADHYIDDLD